MAILRSRARDRTENLLREHLLGRTVRVEFGQQFLKHHEPSLAGVLVSEIEGCGSRARVGFADGRVLVLDLQEVGAWRVYARGEEWDRPRVRARVIFHTDTHAIAVFSPPIVVLCSDGDPACEINCWPMPGETSARV